MNNKLERWWRFPFREILRPVVVSCLVVIASRFFGSHQQRTRRNFNSTLIVVVRSVASEFQNYLSPFSRLP